MGPLVIDEERDHRLDRDAAGCRVDLLAAWIGMPQKGHSLLVSVPTKTVVPPHPPQRTSGCPGPLPHPVRGVPRDAGDIAS